MSTTAEHQANGVLGLFGGLRDPERIAAQLETPNVTAAILQSLLIAFAGSASFGLWTGLYAMTLPQFIASALKAPILLIGTTAICFPTFFIVQYVLAPRALSLQAAAVLQASTVAIIAVTWAVVALPCSLFIANAENYAAAKLLVTFVGAFGGLIGMFWFARGFNNASAVGERRGSPWLLLPYCALFALVGAQLAWSLRPFLGSPSLEFVLFRPIGGNLLESLLFTD
jgi:hypothetical protein